MNAAFAPVMTGDELTLQADYVPLAPYRPALPGQPAVVALPVPTPYATRYVSARRDRASRCPTQSARSSTGSSTRAAGGHRAQRRRRPSRCQRQAHLPAVPPLRQLADGRDAAVRRGARGARHSARAGRRQGVPRARRGRGDPRGARRDRVAGRRAVGVRDAARTVLRDRRRGAARVGAPLRAHDGERFKRHASIRFACPRCSTRDTPPESSSCVRSPSAAAAAAAPSPSQLACSPTGGAGRELRAGRSRRSLHELLEATRAHVGFALRTGGEQALANVLHIAELARQYEMGGGISFRGFVDELRVAAGHGAGGRKRRSSRRAATACA